MMKAIRFFTVFSFFVISISAVFAQVTTETKPTETAQVKPVLVNKPTERYRIGLQDVLDIIISRHPELSQGGVKMDSEGRIRLPRIDRLITAVCKTENELAMEIQELYKTSYLRDPFVMVSVREQNSQPLAVIGAVKKPGNYLTNRRLTLLELVAFAGGPDVEFAGTKITVARIGGISGCVTENENTPTTEGLTLFTYKYSEVMSGKTNPLMNPGDIVYVEKTEPIYVTGNVIKPQAISMTENMTLTQAIAATGGTLPASKKSQVEIIRKVNGVEQKMLFDLNAINSKKIENPILLPNDIIFVPTDKVKTFYGEILKAVTGGLGNIFYRVGQ